MIGERVELVKFVHVIGHGVGEWIFLRVQGAGLDHGNRFGQVHAHRDRTEQFESALVDLAGQHTEFHPLHVRGHVNWPQPV